MVLKGVWFKKNMVQSSSCFSAPSGNIRFANSLCRHVITNVVGGISIKYIPFICAQRLRKLVGELGTPVDIKLSEQNESAVFAGAAHRLSTEPMLFVVDLQDIPGDDKALEKRVLWRPARRSDPDV